MADKKEWLVQKDEKGQWYFHHGMHGGKLVTECPDSYLERLIAEDMGRIPLEARNYIDKLVKSRKTRAANAG